MGTEIRTDENVLAFAIHDALNIFVRDVLVGKGIVDRSTIDAHQDDIDEGLRAIISVCVENWKVSTFNEDA